MDCRLAPFLFLPRFHGEIGLNFNRVRRGNGGLGRLLVKALLVEL